MGNKLSLRNRFEWDRLVSVDDYSIRESAGLRWLIGSLISLLPLMLGIGFLLDPACSDVAGGILTAIGSIPILWAAFEPQIRKMHYTYDLDYKSQRAVEWYRSLTKDERKLLPDGWEDLVRAEGEQEMSAEYHWQTVAAEMQQAGEKVVAAYRLKNDTPKIPDYRLDVYLQLMEEKAKELQQDIADQKEIEDKIKEMN